MAKFRILSIDGGGIRGVIPVVLLQRLAAEPGLVGWLDQVDLIAGTSTGGLIALALARPLNLQVIRDLYETRGEKVFDDSWLDDVVDLGKIVGADYDISKLQRELKAIFNDVTLRQLVRRVLIPTFDLDNEEVNEAKRTWKPKIFHNFPGSDSDGGEPVWQVGLRTCAAPTYFESFDGYVDGGVYANNPSMCALAQTQDERISDPPALRDVVMLSLGTGYSLTYIKGKSLDWGFAQWAKPLINLMMDGVNGIADYQCRQILGTRYQRLAPVFPPGVSMPMDAVERVPEMVEFAEKVDLDETTKWLKSHWT